VWDIAFHLYGKWGRALALQDAAATPLSIARTVSRLFDGQSAQGRQALRLTYTLLHTSSDELLSMLPSKSSVSFNFRSRTYAQPATVSPTAGNKFKKRRRNRPADQPELIAVVPSNSPGPTLTSGSVPDSVSASDDCNASSSFSNTGKASVSDRSGSSWKKRVQIDTEMLDACALPKSNMPDQADDHASLDDLQTLSDNREASSELRNPGRPTGPGHCDPFGDYGHADEVETPKTCVVSASNIRADTTINGSVPVLSCFSDDRDIPRTLSHGGQPAVSDTPKLPTEQQDAEGAHDPGMVDSVIPPFSHSMLACMDTDSRGVNEEDSRFGSIRSSVLSELCAHNDNATDGFHLAQTDGDDLQGSQALSRQVSPSGGCNQELSRPLAADFLDCMPSGSFSLSGILVDLSRSGFEDGRARNSGSV
jgi:hypothetical protein